MIGSVPGEVPFDPETITDEQMKALADGIEEYVELMQRVMIIDDETERKYGKRIREGMETTKELIKKLRKGKRKVFKDD